MHFCFNVRAYSLLYAQFDSGDGNMHLQRRFKEGNRFQNPSFIGDAGFWAPPKGFKEWINKTHPDNAEEKVRAYPITLSLYKVKRIGTWAQCDVHTLIKVTKCHMKAGNPLCIMNGAMLETSGIYAVTCRHCLFKPSSVVDLQKGKRWGSIQFSNFYFK